MANEVRLRSNFALGTITDNPLAIGATTVNSAAFTNLPVVDTTNHLMLVLDPTGINGAPEIVRVTAHAVSSTACTITRATEGTNARAHQQNETRFLAPTRYDYETLALQAGRPTGDLYVGQRTFDTDKMRPNFWDGLTWVQQGAGGQLGYAQETANQTISSASEDDLKSLSVTVTVAANRRIRISHYEPQASHTVLNDVFDLRIKEGSTPLQVRRIMTPGAGDVSGAGFQQIVLTPSAGPHTYKVVGIRVSGSGNEVLSRASTQPASLLVEDIGSAL
jgi:hypothetical protein